MTLLTEENGWAIVWMNEKYYLRHMTCGAYLRRNAAHGCTCRRLRKHVYQTATQVDDTIMKKFTLLTKGEWL
jgi:hypothetical protein